MSVGTYYSISGTVTMDARALAAFSTLTSSTWLAGEKDPEVPYSDLIHITRVNPNQFVAKLRGGFRNLGRYLELDLARSGAIGKIHGAVTMTCTDGSTFLSRTVYSHGRVFHGSSNCLNDPGPTLYWCDVLSFENRLFLPDVFLPIVEENGSFIELDQPVDLPDALDSDYCSCGGWDDETDSPICESHYAVEPMSPPAPDLVRTLTATVDRFTKVWAGEKVSSTDSPLVQIWAVSLGVNPPEWNPNEAWEVSWARALVDDQLPDGLYASETLPEPVQLALMHRGVARELSCLPTLTGSELAKLFGLYSAILGQSSKTERPKTLDIRCEETLAKHPSVTDELILTMGLNHSSPHQLAGNLAVSDKLVGTLPARVLTDFPQRAGNDPDVQQLVRTLAADWDGNVTSLITAIESILSSPCT